MGRAKKYHSDADRLDAAKLAADVINEIRAQSGFTYVELSAFLEKHKIIVGEDMLRQYGSGQKPIGAKRLAKIAEAAALEKIAGDKCREALLFSHPVGIDLIGTLESLRAQVQDNEMGLHAKDEFIAEQKAYIAALETSLKESRKNDQQSMFYLSEIRAALGHEGNFPSLVDAIKQIKLGEK